MTSKLDLVKKRMEGTPHRNPNHDLIVDIRDSIRAELHARGYGDDVERIDIQAQLDRVPMYITISNVILGDPAFMEFDHDAGKAPGKTFTNYVNQTGMKPSEFSSEIPRTVQALYLARNKADLLNGLNKVLKAPEAAIDVARYLGPALP